MNKDMGDFSKKQKKYIITRIIIPVIILSLLIGGLSGIISGLLFYNNSFLINKWVSSNFLLPFKSSNQKIEEHRQVFIEEDSATIDVVKKASPAVVSIVIYKEISDYGHTTGPFIFPFDDFFNQPFNFSFPDYIQPKNTEPQEKIKQRIGGGSGFIISDDGLVLTNKHVIKDDEAEYKVTLLDGKEYDAEILGRDPFNDIGVLRIQAENLPVLELGNSDRIEIGQTVIAIGYALTEYSNTVTKGVISGIGREIVAGDGRGSSEKLENVIQTDTAINPGNSGGPLLNLSGQVIGINTAINREGQLIGFAIPINSAKKVVKSVLETGKIVRPYLGVRYVMITKSIAESNKLSVDYGALIVRGELRTDLAVLPGSPADKAGLQENDIILELNKEKITTDNTLAEIISKYEVNNEITLKILHKGEEKEIRVVLGELEE